jgi:hypothetical protein
MAGYTKLVAIQAVFEIGDEILIVFFKVIDAANSTVEYTLELPTFPEN